MVASRYRLPVKKPARCQRRGRCPASHSGCSRSRPGFNKPERPLCLAFA